MPSFMVKIVISASLRSPFSSKAILPVAPLKLSFNGATGPIAFDDKGDRKDAEITMFVMKGGKLEPTAIVKGGKTTSYEDFVKASAPAPAAPAPAAAEPAKDAPKAEMKK